MGPGGLEWLTGVPDRSFAPDSGVTARSGFGVGRAGRFVATAQEDTVGEAGGGEETVIHITLTARALPDTIARTRPCGPPRLSHRPLWSRLLPPVTSPP